MCHQDVIKHIDRQIWSVSSTVLCDTQWLRITLVMAKMMGGIRWQPQK